MRVALVHDWLITWRGGEKVLEVLAERFPQAELFTLFHAKGAMSAALEARRIHTSVLDALPFARAHHRHLLPLMPLAVRGLDLEGFDLVISSSHAVAKGVRVPPGARHLAYVHAPLRYMWDRFDDYFGPGRASRGVRVAARALRPALRAWDVASSRGVDRFVANSRHVARQIAARYGREAAVVYPPVELERFTAQPLEGGGRGGYFLWVGALAPYKRLDLALEAFARLRLPLKIAGLPQGGRALRLPANVELLGEVSDAALPDLYRGARALIFPGLEDFGLTPLEALACGRPVIAFAGGGALETLTPQTGLFFGAQEVQALVSAVEAFDRFEEGFSPQAARAQALRFSKAAFLEGIEGQLQALGGGPW